MRHALLLSLSLTLALAGGCASDNASKSQGKTGSGGWRSLPLVTNDRIDPAWKHTGFGGFVVDDGVLRTEPAPEGLGLLVFAREKFGDCQIRVVYRPKDGRSNSGVYVRIDDGILDHMNDKVPAATRGAYGALTPEGSKAMEQASDKELGAWYAVHHGFEVQIADGGDEFHRTGAIYSYAPAQAVPPSPDNPWRTMVITLEGTRISVDLDGNRVTEFDSTNTNVPPRKQWHEPRREPKRPTHGYIGLQNHDPGDLVWFKEVSVRKLPS
jgi:hypothetical protein